MNRDNRNEWMANQYLQAIIDSNNSLNKKNLLNNQIKSFPINFKPTKGKNLVERVIGWFVR